MSEQFKVVDLFCGAGGLHMGFEKAGYDIRLCVDNDISLAIVACAFLCGQIFKIGVFHNIGWILVGSLFVINPVWPKAVDWRNHDELKKGIRIGSVLVIMVYGFLIRYGV